MVREGPLSQDRNARRQNSVGFSFAEKRERLAFAQIARENVISHNSTNQPEAQARDPRWRFGLVIEIAAMPITVACPNCQMSLKAPDHLMGKTVKCPKCATMFAVPA